MRQNLIVLFICLMSFTGCNFLDMVPEDDIETIETIFEKREDASLWLESCYSFLQRGVGSVSYDPAFLGSDELVAGTYLRQRSMALGYYTSLFIGDGLQMSQEPYGNIWTRNGHYAAIRYCNIFVENISRVYNMPDAEKRLWTAEIKALKAYLYYDLVQHYGPIVLVPENIDNGASIDAMQQPRSHVDDCIKAITDLLDEALEYLPPLASKDLSRRVYFSQEGALALKAKALLLAASPLFNGNPAYANVKNKAGEPLFSSTYDPEKWRLAAEAADEAIRVCEANGRRLVRGNLTEQTPLLNTMKDIEYSSVAPVYESEEVLLMIRPYNGSSDTYAILTLPNIPNEVDPTQYHHLFDGCVGPSMKMVEMYYTRNGLPIDVDMEWNYYATRYRLGREVSLDYRNVVSTDDEVLRLHLQREPRFYANIAADRCYWQRGLGNNALLKVQPYRNEKFGTSYSTINSSVPQNISGYWLKKGSYSNVSGRDYNTVLGRDEPLVLIRLAELYLIKAEAWNEYEGPSKDRVYAPLNVIRERAGIPDVEVSWTSFSNTPTKIQSKEGMREIIQREWNIEFAFEGKRFWNVRRWLTAQEELNGKQYGWNVLGENAATFYNNFEGPIPVGTEKVFTGPRDYLFPLRAEEVLVSGCVQNPGW